MRRESSAEVALLFTVVIWSLNFTAVKSAIGPFEPLSFAAVRFGLGALVTVALVRWREGAPRFRRADLPLLVAAALTGTTLNQFSFVNSLREGTAVNAALLIGTIPIWTTVVAMAAGQERPAARHWVGVLAGMAGVLLIVLGGAGRLGGGSPLGDVFALGTAATWGIYSVMIRPLMARYSALQLSAFVMSVGTVGLVLVGLPSLAVQRWEGIGGEPWLALLYATFFSVVLTNLLYFTAIHRVGAARAALFIYLEPFLGVLFAVVLLGETVTAVQLLGGVVVIGAILLGRTRRPPIAEPGV